MVKRENLLVVAGLFWIIAGVNVAGVGIQAFLGVPSASWWWMVPAMAVVFVGFGFMFRKVSMKHEARILTYADPSISVLRTFDVKGYLIIAIMMGGGMALRFSGAVPLEFIGFFYPGLGVALALTGVGFLLKRRTVSHPSSAEVGC